MWMAKLVAIGEVVIGVALILGLFTGIVAFLGLILNFSFVFSGSAGVNPAFILVGLLLALAWRNAGWIGLDRLVLPRLGTPWQPATRGGAGPRLSRPRERAAHQRGPLRVWWRSAGMPACPRSAGDAHLHGGALPG